MKNKQVAILVRDTLSCVHLYVRINYKGKQENDYHAVKIEVTFGGGRNTRWGGAREVSKAAANVLFLDLGCGYTYLFYHFSLNCLCVLCTIRYIYFKKYITVSYVQKIYEQF